MTDQPRIDAALLTHLGQLAHLQLPAEREAALRAKLQALVAAFSALDDADAEVAAHAEELRRLREEELRKERERREPLRRETVVRELQEGRARRLCRGPQRCEHHCDVVEDIRWACM